MGQEQGEFYFTLSYSASAHPLYHWHTQVAHTLSHRFTSASPLSPICTHARHGEHGSSPWRVQRLPAHDSGCWGRPPPSPAGGRLGALAPAASVRHPGGHGIAPGGLQRGHPDAPDRLFAAGKELLFFKSCFLVFCVKARFAQFNNALKSAKLERKRHA